MLILGVTGGIATGKSTVTAIFRELGVEVIDADAIAREVTQPGTAGALRIRKEFGEEFFDAEGNLRRKELGARVFADPAERRRVESLLHPIILDEIRRRLDALRKGPGAREKVVVVEAPVLLEAGAAGIVDGVVLVVAEQRTQKRRLTLRGGMSQREIMDRIASQMSQKEKLRFADYVIDTDCPMAETRRQVEALWHRLRTEMR